MKRRYLFIGAAAIGLVLLAYATSRVAERGRFATPYSSYGGGAKGMKGLYLLTEALGAKPVRWSRELSRLPSRALLVAFGGCDAAPARDVSRLEAEALTRFIEEGGTLLVAGARYAPTVTDVELEWRGRACEAPSTIERALRGQPAPDAEERREERSPPSEEAERAEGEAEAFARASKILEALGMPLFEDPPEAAVPVGQEVIGTIPLPIRGPAALSLRPDALIKVPEVLLAIDGDLKRPAGWLLPKGRGRVIVLSSAEPFTNAGMREGDGAAFFARLVHAFAPGGPVLFDEYHLGVGEKRSAMRYFRDLGLGPALLILCAALGVVFWRNGASFGAPHVELAPAPKGTASYVAGVGSLYARTNDAEAALAAITRRAIDHIAEHFHLKEARLSEGRADDASLDALLARGKHEAARQAVRAIRELGSTPVREPELASRVNEIDRQVINATRSAASTRRS